jgi:phenylacetate-CoA ligase
MAHAYERVPYYRRLLDRAGLSPRDIRTAADLALIPITSRRDLQGLSPSEIVARGISPERLIHHASSGSSGEPVVIRRTWLEERIGNAFRLRALRDMGVRAGDRRVTVAQAAPHDPRNWQLPQRILRAAGAYRRVRLSALRPPEAILHDLRRLQPDVIGGYPNTICQVAQLLTDDDRRLLSPRLIVTGGEALTPFMRHRIASAFGAPVFEIYGSYEFPLIAWQCGRARALHVAEDAVILEVLRDGRPVKAGEPGEVVCTQLHAFAMPFIRYRLGDIVTRAATPCACGAPFSTLGAIQGRMLDYFRLPGGRLVHPYELGDPLVDEAGSWLRRFQLVQEAENLVVLTVVPSRSPSAQELAVVQRIAAAAFGPEVRFRVAFVDAIPAERSGKFRVYQSVLGSASAHGRSDRPPGERPGSA